MEQDYFDPNMAKARLVVLLILLFAGFLIFTPALSTFLGGMFSQQGVRALSGTTSDSLSAPMPMKTTSMSVLGAPSITARFIGTVLCEAGSPACGTQQALYNDAVTAGIDPVFPLAFFWHESSYGKYGFAAHTHSLGNIICTPGYACLGRFRSYPTFDASYLDWMHLIKSEYIAYGLTTVSTIIPKYAPSLENDTQGYIAKVEWAVSEYRMGHEV